MGLRMYRTWSSSSESSEDSSEVSRRLSCCCLARLSESSEEEAEEETGGLWPPLPAPLLALPSLPCPLSNLAGLQLPGGSESSARPRLNSELQEMQSFSLLLDSRRMFSARLLLCLLLPPLVFCEEIFGG